MKATEKITGQTPALSRTMLRERCETQQRYQEAAALMAQLICVPVFQAN